MRTLERACVAILDDDEAMCSFIAEVVELAGFRAVVAQDGRQLAVLLDERPVLLVLDLGMRGMDGIEVIRQLAAAGFAGRLLLASAFDMPILNAARNLAAMQGLQVAGVLTKPFRAQALTAILQLPGVGNAKTLAFAPITLRELELAVDNNELVLHYQPQVRLRDGAWVGMEALVRWQHPVHGLLLPDSFVSLAESNGLALPLTRCVIAIALKDFARAAAALEFSGKLSINLPPAAMTDVSIPDAVVAAVAEIGCDSVALQFEVTETSVAPDPTKALDILTRLRIKGFTLSIDDFGTGHSSLEKLQLLPFSELKIDLYFVRLAQTDASARVIVENSIELGRKLSLTVLAEGVENETLWRWLRDAGCELAQGYFIAKPLALAQIAEWKTQWDARMRLIAPTPGGAAAVQAPGLQPTASLMAPNDRPRVAILDDDVALCAFMREVAEQAGFTTDVAHDGRDLAKLLASDPAVLILDLAMPHLDGIEVICHLGQARFGGRLVLVSGFDTLMLDAASTLAELQGLHVVGAFTKPIRAEALRRVLLSPSE